MATEVIPNRPLTLSLFFFYLFSFPIILFSKQTPLSMTDEITKKDISKWCATVPHPNLCHHLVMAKSEPISSKEFRALTIRAALDQATKAHSHATRLSCHSKIKGRNRVCRECIGLIDDTIVQLTAALQSSVGPDDAQTWLSAALTNIEMCRAGPIDLNLTRFASPFLLGHNLPKMISNSLAANAARSRGFPLLYRSGFPRWVTRGERKLLTMGDAELASMAGVVVVSKDGEGRFRKVQEGIEYAAGRMGEGRAVVYVRRGVYEENVVVNRTMRNVMLVGEGVRYTVITGNRSVSGGFTTFNSGTMGVDGPGFMARGITFRNTAGPDKGQAVALRSASDLSVFYACSFEGYQDTLFVQSQRQFYKSCLLYGTIDIIFGNAATVLQNCVIYVRQPLPGQANMVTAQGRGDPFQNTGISIHRCRIVPAPGLRPASGSFKTYLGRPWQQYSRTVVMKTYLDELVAPEGWSTWGDSGFALSSLYYGEYQNFGPGAATAGRVRWPGFHGNMSADEAARFSVAGLIAGWAWLPETGVPFTAGL